MNNDGNYLKATAISRMTDTDLCRGRIHQLGGKGRRGGNTPL